MQFSSQLQSTWPALHSLQDAWGFVEVCSMSPHVFCGCEGGIWAWHFVGYGVQGPLLWTARSQIRTMVYFASSTSDLFPMHVGFQWKCAIRMERESDRHSHLWPWTLVNAWTYKILDSSSRVVWAQRWGFELCHQGGAQRRATVFTWYTEVACACVSDALWIPS